VQFRVTTVTDVRENEGILTVVFSDEAHHGRSERKALIYSIIQGYVEEVAQIVSRGQQQGHTRPDADPGKVSVMFPGHLSEGGFDVTRHVERAGDLLSKTLRTS